jgi:hypothetical protein
MRNSRSRGIRAVGANKAILFGGQGCDSAQEGVGSPRRAERVVTQHPVHYRPQVAEHLPAEEVPVHRLL